MSFKREPETERIVVTPGQTVISLGPRLVKKKTPSSSLKRQVATNYLVVGEVTPSLVGNVWDNLRDLFRDLFGDLSAVAGSVTTVAKLRAAGILARAVSV